jgi:hypothetical protein
MRRHSKSALFSSEDEDTFGIPSKDATDIAEDPSHAEKDAFGIYEGLDDDQSADAIALVAKTIRPDGSAGFRTPSHAHSAGRDRNTGYATYKFCRSSPLLLSISTISRLTTRVTSQLVSDVRKPSQVIHWVWNTGTTPCI